MVLGLFTSSDDALYWYRSTSRFMANTDECTDIVVRKCAFRH